MKKEKTWRDVPIGGMILDPGNSAEYKTGSWRSYRPIPAPEKCNHCLQGWVSCPDFCVEVEDEKVVGIDLDYCKGCGICEKVCPPKVKAITMVLDTEAEKK